VARPPRYCSGGYSHCVQKSTVNYDKAEDIARDIESVFFQANQTVIGQMWTLWCTQPLLQGCATKQKSNNFC
jgi:hypothetical protein